MMAISNDKPSSGYLRYFVNNRWVLIVSHLIKLKKNTFHVDTEFLFFFLSKCWHKKRLSAIKQQIITWTEMLKSSFVKFRSLENL